METLFENIPALIRAALIAGSAVTLAWLAWRHEQLFAAAKESGAGRILAFEFAGTPSRASALLYRWSTTDPGLTGAGRAIRLDYWLAVAYAVLLATSCGSLAGVMGERTWSWADTAGSLIALGALAAGLMDWVENTALLQVIRQHLEAPPPQETQIGGGATRLAWISAFVKFVLIFAALVNVLIGLGVLIAGPRPG
jgi:hypothetical protein